MEEKLIVEEAPKSEEQKKKEKYSYTNIDIKDNVGFLSNLFFYWAYRIIKLANITSIKYNDLGITSEINSISYYFDSLYKTKSNNKSIISTIFQMHTCKIILIIFMNILNSIMLIGKLLLFRYYTKKFKLVVNSKELDKDIINLGIEVIGLSVFVSFFSRQVEKLQSNTAYECGAEINCLIYDKILKSFSISTNGKKFTSAEIINFIQVNIEKMINGLRLLPTLLNVPLLLIIEIIILFYYMGFGFLIGLVVLILLIMLNICLQQRMKKTEKAKQEALDKRMKITSTTLFNLKVFKMYSWDNFFLKKIYEAREYEIQCFRNFFNVANKIRTLLWFAPMMTSTVSIGAYIYFIKTINVEDIYICLSIFSSMQDLLRAFGNVLSGTIEMMVSVKRIENFLNSSEFNYKTNYIETNSDSSISLSIEKGNFKWNTESKKNSEVKDKEAIQIEETKSFELKDINLSIKKGELVFIIGEVGSGKSSLFNSIIGNMLPNDKDTKVTINGSIAYVSQMPWIQNKTLQNNILFYSKYNEEKYREAINSSELQKDIEILSRGDQTEIGEKGVNLSGGQKMRVALARAVYSNRDIYLIDDIFSAVDSNVSRNIMQKCIQGCLKDKTRIIITHHLQYLHYADKIIYMKEGKINFIGNYDELQKEELYNAFSTTLKNNNNTIDSNSSNKVTKSKPLSSIASSPSSIQPKQQGKSLPFKIYKKYFSLIGTWKFHLLIIILVLIWQGLRGASDIWLAKWLNNPEKSLQNNYIIYASLGISSTIFLYIRLTTFAHNTLISSLALHKDMINHLIRAPINLYHDIVQRVQILNQLSKDLVGVDFFGSVMLGNSISFGTALISSIIVASIYQPYCLVFLPLLILLWYFIMYYYLVASRQFSRLDSMTRTQVLNMVNETSSGIETIRAYKVQNLFTKAFHQKQDEFVKINYFSRGAALWLDLLLELFANFFLLVQILTSFFFPSLLSPGIMGLLFTYTIQIQNHLLSFIIQFNQFNNSMFAFDRCVSYTTIPSERPEKTQKDPSLTEWPSKGKIVFDNVSIQYRKDTKTVLSDISFTINPKEKIGICGRTGSGKSTLTLALFRIIEAQKGKILIDDVDISEVGLSKLRSNLTIIPQEPCLVEGTLKSNIDPLNIYSEDMIKEVMQKINFWYICENNTDGINMKIEANGDNLSVGEKQLVCITRAILRQSKIVILDEATSNIDYKKEEVVQKAIENYLSDSTILSIAHRIKTIKNMDRILVLDEGKVVEYDKPDVLLKNNNSIFYKLYYNANMEYLH